MEMNFKNYVFAKEEQNLTITRNMFIGLTGTNTEQYVKALNLSVLNKGTLLINDNKITKENIKVFRKRIYTIPKEFTYPFDMEVKTYLLNEVQKRNLTFKDIFKKLQDSLKIVGLNEAYFTKPLYVLSTLEKKLLQLASALLSNPELVIIEEPFLGIDLHNEKKMVLLLKKLAERYHKIFILVTDNIDALYQYTNKIIITNKNKILTIGSTKEVLEDTTFLKRNRIPLPEIIEFTYLARTKKQVKIDYHNDIRDIIKDIYKHV